MNFSIFLQKKVDGPTTCFFIPALGNESTVYYMLKKVSMVMEVRYFYMYV